MHGINLLSHKANIEDGLISITAGRGGDGKKLRKTEAKGQNGAQRTAKRDFAALF